MLNKWYSYLIQATSQTAKPLSYQHNTRQLLQQAGFTDISEQVIQAPYRAWSVDPVQIDIGNFNQTALDLCYGLEALSLGPFSRVFNWTRLEIEAFMAEVRREIRNRELHAYNNMYDHSAPILGLL